ncbi:hypothetical protein [Streptomyces halobius]|uniref:Uncharacterized protein n=1 Tax=Streptomyces halobius TaxID=2879846 RepID=A0ABY4MAE0_9ACTN|nr:hypothetical protein [Streptomyces halobius]UQA94734.1 hypothetical protein K9S39_25310 [Streptomyces halobius]
MSAHQPSPTPAARRAEDDAREQPPTMNELLAACAAATAVSTPPDAPEETRAGKRAEPADEPEAGAAPSTQGRDAA